MNITFCQYLNVWFSAAAGNDECLGFVKKTELPSPAAAWYHISADW